MIRSYPYQERRKGPVFYIGRFCLFCGQVAIAIARDISRNRHRNRYYRDESTDNY